MPNIADYLDERTLRIVGRRASRYVLIADGKAKKQDPKAFAVLADTQEGILWPPQYLQALIKFNDWEEVKDDSTLLKKLLELPWVADDIPGVGFTWSQANERLKQ